MSIKDFTMTTRKLTTKAIAQSATTYVGQTGEIFYDTATATLKLSDGATAGGNVFGLGGGGLTAGSGTGFAAQTGAGIGSYVALVTLPNQTCALNAVWRVRAFGNYTPVSSANARNLAATVTFGTMGPGTWNLSAVPTSSTTPCHSHRLEHNQLQQRWILLRSADHHYQRIQWCHLGHSHWASERDLYSGTNRHTNSW
jgi:hypothetical protein